MLSLWTKFWMPFPSSSPSLPLSPLLPLSLSSPPSPPPAPACSSVGFSTTTLGGLGRSKQLAGPCHFVHTHPCSRKSVSAYKDAELKPRCVHVPLHHAVPRTTKEQLVGRIFWSLLDTLRGQGHRDQQALSVFSMGCGLSMALGTVTKVENST